MAYPNFKKNYSKKNSETKIKNNIGRAQCTEPIILSGKYFGIKLLSVYEFMQCLKMKNTLTKEMISNGFDEYISRKVCEYACLVSMCLYNSQNSRVFASGKDALKHLTPEELKFIYEEYNRLLRKVIKKDNITHSILEKAKKYYYKKEEFLK